ncbi:receptor-like protein Cf-9 homolog [Hevea brasiliensis]|uniref:receptor-like protein Cf-9 homolog n=1 Tax=Hevea brasiliensis TaxID=3981 RepID=UPI0025E10678|nr:receptor-like protein Cf-9 homolog [Hevea brasiliensis]
MTRVLPCSNSRKPFPSQVLLLPGIPLTPSLIPRQSWKEGSDCCSWDGITCDIETGNVIGLDLSNSLLYGTIYSNNPLFLLHHLQKLDLSCNDFNNSHVSPQFGQFLNLTYLNLSTSNFVGELPSEISYLSGLVSLDLSWNYDLRLQNTYFKKLVQNLTQLEELDLSLANMSLVVPSSLMNMSSSLTSLKLEYRQLQGKFLDISHLFELTLLFLSGNDHLIVETAYFKKLVQKLTQLQELDLSGVNMSWVIPSSLMNLSFSLTSLKLSESHLQGKFPNISHLSKLVSLDLSHNNFIGQIPSSLGSFKELCSLDLAYNNFNGEIPFSFGNLKQLDTLSLYSNNPSGQIPSSLGSLKKLSSLYLSNNNFNGEIPSSFENLKQLDTLDLYNNNLSVQIPFSLGSF